MMNLYISYDSKNRPIACLLAKNKDFAEIAFSAMNDESSSVEEINISLINDQKVIFILNSEEAHGNNKGTIWRRGK